MLEHGQTEQHHIVFSFSDFSFMCYGCNDYIACPVLSPIEEIFVGKKFGFFTEEVLDIEELGNEETKKEAALDEAQQQAKEAQKIMDQAEAEIKEAEKLYFDDRNIEELAERLKSGCYKNVCIMAGAGISESAGIPDFRSPGSGLWD